MSEDRKDDLSDKTIITQDTLKIRLSEANKTPPNLVLLVGPQTYVGKQWPIALGEMIMGRSPNSQVFVDDRSVSKSHFRLTLSGNDVTLVDLKSTNKTLINGQVVEPNSAYKLKNNDQIKAGNVIFKFLEQGNIETVSTQETYERGRKDPLTGVNNRGALVSKGLESFKRAELLRSPLSVIMIDIDHFKKINDKFGHAAGDYVLKELASVIQEKLIRSDDFFARYGGEEFVLLLHGSNLWQTIEIAERVRTVVEVHPFIYESERISVTISAGVATKDDETDGWETLFRRADQALYLSKNKGRNRVSKL